MSTSFSPNISIDFLAKFDHSKKMISWPFFGPNLLEPFVPATLGRLDPYGGTFGIDWSMPFVLSPLGG